MDYRTVHKAMIKRAYDLQQDLATEYNDLKATRNDVQKAHDAFNRGERALYGQSSKGSYEPGRAKPFISDTVRTGASIPSLYQRGSSTNELLSIDKRLNQLRALLRARKK